MHINEQYAFKEFIQNNIREVIKMAMLVQRTKTVFSLMRRRKVEKEQERAAERLRKQVLNLFWNENKSYREIASLLNVSHTTVWRVVQENEPPLHVRIKLARFVPLLGEA